MDFLAPKNLLWVLPVLAAAIAAATWAYLQRKKAIALLTQNAEQCHLRSNASPIRRRILTTTLLASLVLASIAALRPSGGTTITEYQRPAKNLLVALDLSTSMTATDNDGISRNDAAKLLLRSFIKARPTDKIGLISFAGDNFIETPITLNRSHLLDRLNKIAPGDFYVPGTDLTEALEEARSLLTENPPPGSAVLLFSDGDNITGEDPAKIIDSFKEANIPIISVAFGKNGLPVPVPGTELTTSADHDVLRSLSEATDGLFIEASPREVDAQVAEISDRIDTITLDGENIAGELYERPYDLYAWFLSAALLCLMIHLFLPLRTRQWHPLTTTIIFFFSLPQLLPAEQFDTFEEALEVSRDDEIPAMIVFIGSDWSKLSITFEEEILSHPVFQKWADREVAWALVDLPRVGLSDEARRERRALMEKLGVETFPTAVFLDPAENILGALKYEPDGPKAWTKRAEAILAGDAAASDTAASAEYLPEEIRKSLEDPELTDAQRSVRYFNKGLELEKAEPALTLKSKDRFQLLIDLYNKAADAAPRDRQDLIFAARHQLALLHHRKGQSRLPRSEQEIAMLAMAEGTNPVNLLKRAKRSFETALGIYQNAAPLNPDDEQFSKNLALAYQNRDRTQAYLDFLEAYQKAIETTSLALEQERAFVESLKRDVNTRLEINKAAIGESAQSIQELIARAEAIEDAPTILPEEGLKDYRLADEDIVLAPSPHRERQLEAAAQHIQDALDHLIDPQQMQPQPQSGEGEGDPQEGEEDEEGEGEEEEGGRQRDQEDQNPQGDRPDGDQPGKGEEEGEDGEGGDEDTTENDLKRAEKEGGDLRGRLLKEQQEEFFRSGKRVPRRKSH